MSAARKIQNPAKRGTVRVRDVREAVAEIRARHSVLSTRLKAGAIEIRVLSDAQPAGMQPATPELEDIYFSTLIAHNLKDNLE